MEQLFFKTWYFEVVNCLSPNYRNDIIIVIRITPTLPYDSSTLSTFIGTDPHHSSLLKFLVLPYFIKEYWHDLVSIAIRYLSYPSFPLFKLGQSVEEQLHAASLLESTINRTVKIKPPTEYFTVVLVITYTPLRTWKRTNYYYSLQS